MVSLEVRVVLGLPNISRISFPCTPQIIHMYRHISDGKIHRVIMSIWN
jgi:hypothetical protein